MVQSLECRTLLAAVTDSGTTLQIELELSERLQVQSHGNSYTFVSTAATFQNVGVADASDFSGFGTASLQLTDWAQYSDVQILDAATGASVEFLDSGAAAFGHSFGIALDDGANSQSVIFNGATSFGNHNLTAITDGAILLFAGADLTVNSGDLSLTAVNGGDGSAVKRGINLIQAGITTTGTGSIVLDGTGAANAPASDNLDGISLMSNSVISSTSTGSDAGTIMLVGTSGVGANFSTGIYVDSSTISSVNGDINLTGTGGGGTGTNHFGIRTTAAIFESTGTGINAATITLNGTGGDGTDWGVGLGMLNDSVIRSVDGNVLLVGTGGHGSGNNNTGARLSNFLIQSTGTGTNAANITLSAVGGSGGNNNGAAALEGDTSEIRTIDGAISLVGEGSTSVEYGDNGLWIAASIRSTGIGPINIVGTGGSGGQQTAQGVGIVGATTIIQSDTATITITGKGGNTTSGFSVGARVTDGATVQSQRGGIAITGFGGNGGRNNTGVHIQNESTVRSTGIGADAATITIDGTGGGGDQWNVGLTVSAGAGISSINGDVLLAGQGGLGSGNSNRGINISNANRIESTGTGPFAADITFIGTGGSGAAFNHAIATFTGADHASLISSVDGDITLQANSGQNLTDSSNGAAYLSSSIRSTGDGRIDISGIATGGTSLSRGVWVAGQTTIEALSGAMVVYGVGGGDSGNNNEGVAIANEASLATTSGQIIINGSSGVNSSHGVQLWGTETGGAKILSRGSGGISITAYGDQGGIRERFSANQNTVIGGPDATGNIAVYANTATIHPTSQLQSAGQLWIATADAVFGESISLGGTATDSRSELNLTDEELATIQPGFESVAFGLSLDVPVAIDSVTLTSPVQITGSRITDSTGDDLNVPSVSLRGVIAPAGTSTGILHAIDATLLFESTLQLEFGGNRAGEGAGYHDQVDATGSVDINSNVDLQTVWLPWWRPKGGEQLTIVRRTGGTGKFAGLPEGTTLPDFFNATISYVGGDGDDIVLTLPNNLPALPTSVSLGEISSAGMTVFGSDSGGRVGQSVHAAGDVNGDGIDDFIIGATDANTSDNGRTQAGEAYLIYGSQDPPVTIDLANPGSRGVVFYGAGANQNTGHFVDAADFNNDGYSDVLIGAHRRPGSEGNLSAGGAYVVWGGPSLPETVDLANLGPAGITILGVNTDDLAGNPVAAVGDLNHDGFQDFGLGAIWADSVDNSRDRAGEAYVIFGGTTLPETIDLATFTTGVLRIFGAQAADEAGVSVAALGDVNGDEIDDLAIGARFADGATDQTSRAGESYIIYGSETLPDSIDLAAAADVVIYGTDVDDFGGWPVQGVGDINGDGYNDIIHAASGGDSADNQRIDAGETYIIWGGPSLPSIIHTNNLGDAGITIYGADAGDSSGSSASIVGDLNADGFDDIAIGTHLSSGQNNASDDAGEVYVILGGDDLPQTIDLANPNAADFTLYGANTGDEAGIKVRGAGDVNHDGVDDLIIGARYADSLNDSRPNAGEAYVIFGNSLFVPAIPLVTGPSGRITSQQPTITWDEAANAVSYELWLELIGGDSNPIANPTVTSTSFDVPVNLPIGRYRSWVRANRIASTKSAWSTGTFSVALTTTIHNLPFHAAGSLRPAISWDAVDGATSYRVYISNITLQQAAVVDTIVSSTGFSPSVDLQFGRNRIWVQPIGVGNFAGQWSTAKDYYVGPGLLSPITSTLNTTPTFSWESMPNVASVQIYVQFGSAVLINESGITGNTFAPSAALEAGNYRWWIRPSAANGTPGAWSETGVFNVGGITTIAGPTEAVTNGLANITWEAVDGAGSYEVYLYFDTTGDVIQHSYNIDSTSWQSQPLQAGDYRVWIRSHYPDGSPASWSRAHSFAVTNIDAALSATPLSPLTPTFDLTPTFQWSASTAAASFNLYLTNGQNVFYKTDIPTSNWTPSTALAAGDWRWWVQPVNGSDQTGAWSARVRTDTSARAKLIAADVTNNVPTIRWSEVIGTEHYVLQIDNFATGQLVIREDYLTSTSYTPEITFPSGVYRAWVRAIASDGTLGPWSLKLDFLV